MTRNKSFNIMIAAANKLAKNYLNKFIYSFLIIQEQRKSRQYLI